MKDGRRRWCILSRNLRHAISIRGLVRRRCSMHRASTGTYIQYIPGCFPPSPSHNRITTPIQYTYTHSPGRHSEVCPGSLPPRTVQYFSYPNHHMLHQDRQNPTDSSTSPIPSSLDKTSSYYPLGTSITHTKFHYYNPQLRTP